MFYSASSSGFYSREIHGDNIPVDAVEITDVEHQALLNGQSAGQRIVADSNGYPMLADPPPPTPEQVRATAVADIERRRDDALRAGVDVAGTRYHSDDTFLTELLGMLLGYQAGVYAPADTQAIRTMDNTVVQLNAQQITALASAVGAHRRAVYAQSWAEKDAL